MTYFERFSLFIAVGVTVFATGLKANALPVDEVASAHADTNSGTQEVTNEDYSNEAPLIYDYQTIEAVVDYMNVFATMDSGNGIVLSSVTLDESTINLNNICQPLIGLGLAYADEDNIEDFKQELALLIYDTLEEFGLDDNGNSFLDVMVSKNIAISFNYYVQGIKTPALAIYLTAEYIEQIGEVQKYGYSI